MTDHDNTDPWRQRISASGIPDLIREILLQLESRDAADTAEQDHLGRQRYIVETIGRALESVDPLLIAGTTIKQLAAQLRKARDHLSQWIDSGASADLTTNASAALEAALPVLGTILVATGAAELSDEITSLRRSVGQHRGQVDREIVNLRAASKAAQEEFADRTDVAARRVSELEAEVTRVQAELERTTSSAQEQGSQQQNAFGDAQTKRQEAFDGMLSQSRGDVAAAVESLQKQIADQLSQAQSTVQDELAIVQADKERVEDILGIVGEEALVGTYSKNAGSDRKEANKWRLVALGAAAATAAVGVWVVASAGVSGTDWDLFAAKSVLALPFAGSAAYAAKQSSEHRHTQREAEHVALQLAALKPYLNDLENPEDRDVLLGEIARRLFGQPRRHQRQDINGQLGDGPGTASQIAAILQESANVKPQ